MYSDPSGYFPILGLLIGTIIGVASGAIADASLVSGSVINQMATSPILNTLFVQGITDVINIGITVVATYLGHLTGKLVVKGIKAVGKGLKDFYYNFKTPNVDGPMSEVTRGLEPGDILHTSQNIMTSFGGTFNKTFDDGDDSWDIFDYPY